LSPKNNFNPCIFEACYFLNGKKRFFIYFFSFPNQTKETVANYTAGVSVANAQAALTKAINRTLVALENAGSSFTKALVGTKMSLHKVIEIVKIYTIQHN
jgi:hypothetical protein